MHDAVTEWVESQRPADLAELTVLEFGSRDLNGTVRTLFAGCAGYLGVDTVDGPAVDLVANASTVDVGTTFDLVVCTEVLEHVTDDIGAAICANAHRHLNPGGVFIATMAGEGRAPHSARAAGPLESGEFYRNVTRTLLAAWLTDAGFTDFVLDTAGRDLRCAAWKEKA